MLEQAKDALKALLGDFYDEAYTIGFHLVPVINTDTRLYWPFALVFLLVAFVIHVRQERGRVGIKSYFAFVFPKDIYLHKDTIVALKYYVLFGVFVALTHWWTFSLSTSVSAGWTEAGLTQIFGERAGAAPGLLLSLILTLLIMAASDFGFYVQHWLFHKIPALWEIHKVHHCPRRMMPIIDGQFHPLEVLVRGTIAALTAGPIVGSVNYFLAPLNQFTIWDIGAIGLVVNILGNFRHSHIWIEYPQWLSRVVSSPAMHQTHHSVEARHINRNYAIVFSLWDWIFGTIYMPRGKETFEVGLGDEKEARDHDTAVKLLVMPVIKAAGALKPAVPASPPRRG